MGKPLPSKVSAPPVRRSVVDIIQAEVARGEGRLSPLGRKLLEARRRIEQSGVPLLNRRQVQQEKAARRGGAERR